MYLLFIDMIYMIIYIYIYIYVYTGYVYIDSEIEDITIYIYTSSTNDQYFIFLVYQLMNFAQLCLDHPSSDSPGANSDVQADCRRFWTKSSMWQGM